MSPRMYASAACSALRTRSARSCSVVRRSTMAARSPGRCESEQARSRPSTWSRRCARQITVDTLDTDAFADLLHETAEHHGAFEALAPPHNWWDWYAAYFQARQGGSTSGEATEVANRYMADVKHIVLPG